MNGERVLLIVDMLTQWDFDGAEKVARDAESVIGNINAIRSLAGEELRVVYANDLDGGFHGSCEQTVARAVSGQRPDLVEPLVPAPSDDFIHKGQHSAFYGTPLAHLLDIGECRELILCGQVAEQCVLYTALDAHVRGYDISVVTDAILAADEELGKAALRMMEENMGARLMSSHTLIRELQASASEGRTSDE